MTYQEPAGLGWGFVVLLGGVLLFLLGAGCVGLRNLFRDWRRS